MKVVDSGRNGKRKLYRSAKNSMIGGVCGGVADYLDKDPTLIRVFFVVLAFVPFLPAVLPYLIMWLLIPLEPAK